MFGLVGFDKLTLKWSDPIPWQELGVFTADRPNLVNHLVLYFLGSVVFFYALFKVCEWFLENHGKLVFNPNSEFFKMPTKVKKEYYSRIVSDVHAIASIAISIYVTYFICENP
jgi:hypothetical protein